MARRLSKEKAAELIVEVDELADRAASIAERIVGYPGGGIMATPCRRAASDLRAASEKIALFGNLSP